MVKKWNRAAVLPLALALLCCPAAAESVQSAGTDGVMNRSELEITTAYGDADGNGSINAQDALLVLQDSVRIISFSTAQEEKCDVNNDGKITAIDALLVLQYGVEKISTFPVENLQAALYGKTLTIGSVDSGKYLNSSDEDYAIYQARLKEISEQYNATASVVPVSDSAHDFVISIQSGTCEYDLLEVSLPTIRELARMGCSCDFNADSTLRRYAFDSALTEGCTVYDRVYGAAFSAMQDNPLGVFYNQDALARRAPGYDIAALYDSGEWTFDKLEEISAACQRDLDGDGTLDLFGFSSTTNTIGMAVSANAGATIGPDPVTGKITALICGQAGINALDWCKKMYSSRCWIGNATSGACAAEFIAGTTVMFLGELSNYHSIASSRQMSLGFVPMPKGPDQEEYMVGLYSGIAYTVPRNHADSLGAAAGFLNELSGVAEELVAQDGENLLAAGFDEHSVQVYRDMLGYGRADFSAGVISELISQKIDTCVLSRSKNPADVMAEIQPELQEMVDSYYNF